MVESGWYDLKVDLKHEELASVVSATRVSVTRMFTRLRNEGMIKGSRRRYQVNMPLLTALAEV